MSITLPTRAAGVWLARLKSAEKDRAPQAHSKSLRDKCLRASVNKEGKLACLST